MGPGEKKNRMRRAMKQNLTRQVLSMMNTCVRCGLCTDACHFYCSTGDVDLVPSEKLEKVTEVLKKYFGSAASPIGFFSSGKSLDESAVDQLYQAAFEDCTLCGKCALSCPMGINAGDVMFLARAMLCSIERLPEGLVNPVKAALSTGNYLGISTEDFIETIEWIGEELEDELGDDFYVPIDKENTEVLYVPHPLEVRELPFLLMYPMKILFAAGEDYTFSSYGFDTVNYAYHQGSKEKMARIVQRVRDAREKLQAKSIVLAPCGHGYRALRWEADRYIGKAYTYPVLSIVELVGRYVQQGRIQLRKDAVEGPITYHDPCNIARRGGVIHAPRNILKALTSEFVEMEPHGVENYCCGGGGGLASTTGYVSRRLTMGKTKAEQIHRTGAKVVATNCFNCMIQIRDINKAYDLGIQVKSLVEIVADSIVL